MKMFNVEYSYEEELQALEEEAMEKGMEKGREEGIVLGAINVYVSLSQSREVIVSNISRAYNLSKAEAEEFIQTYEEIYGRIIR